MQVVRNIKCTVFDNQKDPAGVWNCLTSDCFRRFHTRRHCWHQKIWRWRQTSNFTWDTSKMVQSIHDVGPHDVIFDVASPVWKTSSGPFHLSVFHVGRWRRHLSRRQLHFWRRLRICSSWSWRRRNSSTWKESWRWRQKVAVDVKVATNVKTPSLQMACVTLGCVRYFALRHSGCVTLMDVTRDACAVQPWSHVCLTMPLIHLLSPEGYSFKPFQVFWTFCFCMNILANKMSNNFLWYERIRDLQVELFWGDELCFRDAQMFLIFTQK